MLTRTLWGELRAKWPRGYWDDWMRLNATRRGRQCIRPEVCRTYNFGREGTSHGQYFAQYLADIALNDVEVDWGSADLAYLEQGRYAASVAALIRRARVATDTADVEAAEGDVVAFYKSDKCAPRMGARSLSAEAALN